MHQNAPFPFTKIRNFVKQIDYCGIDYYFIATAAVKSPSYSARICGSGDLSRYISLIVLV